MFNFRQSLCIGNDAPVFHSLLISQVVPQKADERRPLKGNPAAAAAALKARRDQWAKLSLRQQWADESFMRAHLRAAGLVVASDAEPATEKRLQRLLTRAGIRPADTRAAIGTSLEAYLAANPNLPLWAALALVLEATGRFSVDSLQESREASTIA